MYMVAAVPDLEGGGGQAPQVAKRAVGKNKKILKSPHNKLIVMTD